MSRTEGETELLVGKVSFQMKRAKKIEKLFRADCWSLGLCEALESRIQREGEPGQCRISEAKMFHPNRVNYTRPFLLLHDPSWTL